MRRRIYALSWFMVTALFIASLSPIMQSHRKKIQIEDITPQVSPEVMPYRYITDDARIRPMLREPLMDNLVYYEEYVVPEAPSEPEPEPIIYEPVDEYVATTTAVNMRVDGSLDADIIKVLRCGTSLHRVGIGDEWSQVETSNGIAYVYSEYLVEASEQRLHDIDLLAHLITSEGLDQPPEGQRAIGSVVMNRVGYRGYGGANTVEGVITFPGQFNGYQSVYWYCDYPDSIYQIATEVYDGQTNLPRNVRCFKATYSKVRWDLEFYCQIGDHNFYILP